VNRAEELEAASYATWTADESEEVAGWQVTATSGLSRRTNSARDHGAAVVDDDAIACLVNWYAARNLPLVIRETPLMSHATSAGVRQRWGFKELDETLVMTGATEPGDRDGVAIVATDDSAFQSDLYRLNARPDGDAETLARICGRVAHTSAGVWVPGKGVAAVAVDGRFAAVFSLAVADDHRRQGIATRLMAAACAWAMERSANEMFIQVSGTNPPAIELYESLGFVEAYRYRYLLPVNDARSD
jgi:ribosomal protein S18 acetylase RimI-like enzyme